MAAGRARLESDLEGTTAPRLEPGLGARILGWIEVEVVPIGAEVDRAHDQQPAARARYRHTLRLAETGEVGGIEVDLCPLNAGLRDTEPADPAVEAVGHQHRPGIAEHAEAARAIDFRRVGRSDVSEQAADGRPGDDCPATVVTLPAARSTRRMRWFR